MKLDSATARKLAYSAIHSRVGPYLVKGHELVDAGPGEAWYRTVVYFQTPQGTNNGYYAFEWEQTHHYDSFDVESEFETYPVQPVIRTITTYERA